MRKSIIALALCSLIFAGQGQIQASFFQNIAADKEVTSLRIDALKKEIESGNRAAIDSFWQEITKSGAPLIEPIKSDDNYYILTFVWRAKEETRNVVLIGGIAGYKFENNLMSRLLDTDLWFKTYRIRGDARFTYNISPNDSLVPFDKVNLSDTKAVLQRISTFKLDPFNPNRFPGFTMSSWVELPKAPPQLWIKRAADTPAGKLEEKKIKSAILGNERRAWIYTPPGYKADEKPYNLMVVFDGTAYTIMVPTAAILDSMIAKELIPPMVAVILDNPTPNSRNDELPCNARFADFLAKEVVPWMRQNYNVTSNPNQTVVAGSSYGGLAATFAGFKHPEVFGNVLSQSGSFWWKPDGDEEHEWLTKEFVTSAKLPVRFYLDVGLMERGPTPDNGPDMVTVNRHMRDVLQAKGYELHYAEFNGGHEYLNWRGTLSDGLIYLVGKKQTSKK